VIISFSSSLIEITAYPYDSIGRNASVVEQSDGGRYNAILFIPSKAILLTLDFAAMSPGFAQRIEVKYRAAVCVQILEMKAPLCGSKRANEVQMLHSADGNKKAPGCFQGP
jgi:hypothetical protein